MIGLAHQSCPLYQELCERFRDFTGWPLEYRELGDESISDVEEHLLERGEYCWWRRVDDGANCFGLVVIDLPDQAPLLGSFESVIQFAESIAEFISQHAQSQREIADQAASWRAFSGAGNRPKSDAALPNQLHELLSAAARLTAYQSASFYLLSPDLNRLKLRVAFGIRSEDLPAAERDAVSSWPDLDTLSRGFSFVQRHSELEDLWLPRGSRVGLSVAVHTSLAPLGILWVYDSLPKPYPNRELESLRAVAGHLALILERRVLIRENQTLHRIQNELRVVADHQNRVPRFDLPDSAGLEATFRSLSQHEIGGDLCDLISLEPEWTAIAIGDASGNSVPAALVANAVKGALRSIFDYETEHSSQPAKVIGRLNRAIKGVACDHQFMSLFYGEFHGPTRKLAYCCAGHPSPILVRNGTVSLLEADGFLLGILDEIEYECVECQLEPGDLVVLYTDGISETHGSSGGLFGEQGIIQAIQTVASAPVAAILLEIWDRAEAFAGSGKHSEADDRSLMVLRVK